MSQPSEALGWRSVADLVGHHPDAPVALIGAPLNERSLTPGRVMALLPPTRMVRARWA